MHIPATLSENPPTGAASSGTKAAAATPAAGIPSFASFLSPHENAPAQPRGTRPDARSLRSDASMPSARATVPTQEGPPAAGAPVPLAEQLPAAGDRAAADLPVEKPAKKAAEPTLASALCLALLGVTMPVAAEPTGAATAAGTGETLAQAGRAGSHSGAPQLNTGDAGPRGPLQIGVTGTGLPLGGPVPPVGPGTIAPSQPGRFPAETSASARPADGTTTTGGAAVALGAPRATPEVLAKLGITAPPTLTAPGATVDPTAPAPRRLPTAPKPLSAVERSATVAGLPAQTARSAAAPKSDQVSELLVRQAGPFTTTSDRGGTGTAQAPAMSHDAHAPRSDAAVTSVFHADGVFDAVADPASGAGATADLHAATAHAVEAVSVAVEHASRDRSSVKLDFDIGGERVAVLVERHADEIHATFKADSVELRTALSQQWQASAGERATSTVQPVFTDHASSHQLPDSQSRGFGRQDNPSGQPGGEQAAPGESRGRRGAPRAAAATPAVTSPSLPSRPPAFRPVTSLHLSTTA